MGTPQPVVSTSPGVRECAQPSSSGSHLRAPDTRILEDKSFCVHRQVAPEFSVRALVAICIRAESRVGLLEKLDVEARKSNPCSAHRGASSDSKIEPANWKHVRAGAEVEIDIVAVRELPDLAAVKGPFTGWIAKNFHCNHLIPDDSIESGCICDPVTVASDVVLQPTRHLLVREQRDAVKLPPIRRLNELRHFMAGNVETSPEDAFVPSHAPEDTAIVLTRKSLEVERSSQIRTC